MDDLEGGITAEQFTPRVLAAVERWLDHLASMSLDALARLSEGLRVAVSLVMDAGDLDSAGALDAVAEQVDAIREARIAMETGG